MHNNQWKHVKLNFRFVHCWNHVHFHVEEKDFKFKAPEFIVQVVKLNTLEQHLHS